MENFITKDAAVPFPLALIQHIMRIISEVCCSLCLDAFVTGMSPQTMFRVCEKMVVHYDLAARNILLEGDVSRPDVFVHDWGHALYLPEPHSDDDKTDMRSDVRALGRITLQLLTRNMSVKPPLTATQAVSAMRNPAMWATALLLRKELVPTAREALLLFAPALELNSDV